jgi:hypothetical protein
MSDESRSDVSPAKFSTSSKKVGARDVILTGNLTSSYRENMQRIALLPTDNLISRAKKRKRKEDISDTEMCASVQALLSISQARKFCLPGSNGLKIE